MKRTSEIEKVGFSLGKNIEQKKYNLIPSKPLYVLGVERQMREELIIPSSL